MKRTIQTLLLTLGLLIGLQPLSAAFPGSLDQSCRAAEADSDHQVSGIIWGLGTSLNTKFSKNTKRNEWSGNSDNDYDYAYTSSAVVIHASSVATRLTSIQPNSSGHTLPTSLARLYDSDYDEGGDSLLQPISGVAPGGRI